MMRSWKGKKNLKAQPAHSGFSSSRLNQWILLVSVSFHLYIFWTLVMSPNHDWVFSDAFNLEIAYIQLNCPWARAEGVFLVFWVFKNFISWWRDVFCIQNFLAKPNLSLNSSHCELCTKGRRKETLNMEFLLKICTLGNQC